jgi:hypothetical protein
MKHHHVQPTLRRCANWLTLPGRMTLSMFFACVFDVADNDGIGEEEKQLKKNCPGSQLPLTSTCDR